jgi:alanyl-tRNA synthetase
MDEFTKIEAENLLKGGRKIDGLTIVVTLKVMEEEESLIELSSRITELDPSAVAIVGLKADTARIFVSSGKEAEKRGVQAGQIASNLAKILGGGGGGKGYFGQGGGPKVEMLQEALTKVEGHIKKQLGTKK